MLSLKSNYKQKPFSERALTFLDALLNKSTALLAIEHDAVCVFVNDICDEAVL